MSPPVNSHGSPASLMPAIAEFIRQYAPGRMLRVGIDGVDGVGKTTLADTLAQVVNASGRPVIRASVDGFHNPREMRYRRGKSSPEGFYRDSYNYADLRRVLLDPLGPGGSGIHCPAIFDHRTDLALPLNWSVAEPDAVLMFDGIFLHRAELRDVWDLSIFLHAPFDVTIPRGAGRGPGYGLPDVQDPSNRRYIEGQQMYLRDNDPQALADIVIDYSDFTNPVMKACRWPV